MIAVGKISKSVGVKGEMKVALLTDSADRFRRLKSVWIGSGEETASEFSVQSVRETAGGIVLQLGGIETRSQADERRGQLVFVADKEAVRPKKGSYFIHEIVGMKVVDEAGTLLGMVTEVMQLPANDVWVVKSGDKEVLIHAIREVIRSVNLGQKLVIIRPMEGMLD